MYAKPPTALAACADFAAMHYALSIHSSYELCVTFFGLEVDVSCSPSAGLMLTFAFLEMKQAEPEPSCKIITHWHQIRSLMFIKRVYVSRLKTEPSAQTWFQMT